MGKRRNDIANEQIIELYFNKNYSCSKVAKILNCDRSTILYRIEKEIGRFRKNLTMSEHISKAMEKSIYINDYMNDVLTGELLGDGNISPVVHQAYYKHSTSLSKLEYLEWLLKVFENGGFKIGGKHKIHYRKEKDEVSFFTQSTKELMMLFKKWYHPNKLYDETIKSKWDNRKYIKSPPTDIILNPVVILHWFIGDGTIRSGKQGITLCTHGFSFDAVEFLRFKIKTDLGIGTIHKCDNSIYIIKQDSVKLLNIIGKCPVECYEYKWNLISHRNRKNINDNINMKIVENYIINKDN